MAALISCMPGLSTAAVIGQLHTHSVYGEPVHMEVELFDIAKKSEGMVSAKLLSKKEHANFNMTYPDELESAEISILSTGDHVTINIQGREPALMKEIEFLLKVKWEGGEVTRAFRTTLPGGF